MTTISRLNTTISDHNTTANFIALCLLISGAIVGAVAIHQGGNLAQSTYDSLKPATSTAQKSVTIVQTPSKATPLEVATVGAPLVFVRDTQPNMVAQLQPAPAITLSTQTAAQTLQPEINTIQLTGGADLQNAAAILQ